VNVLVCSKWWLDRLLGVILSGKSSSVRMRVKSTRKPVVDQSEVMVPIKVALYQLWNAYFHCGGEHSIGVSCTFEL